MDYFVDLPAVGGKWRNVFIGKTKVEVIEWIRSNIGHCDDDGNVCLISEIEEDEDEDEDEDEE